MIVDLFGDPQGSLPGHGTLIETVSGQIAPGSFFEYDVTVPAGTDLLHFADITLLIAMTGAAAQGRAAFARFYSIAYRTSSGALQYSPPEGLNCVGYAIAATAATGIGAFQQTRPSGQVLRWGWQNAGFGNAVYRLRARVSVLPAGISMPTVEP